MDISHLSSHSQARGPNRKWKVYTADDLKKRTQSPPSVEHRIPNHSTDPAGSSLPLSTSNHAFPKDYNNASFSKPQRKTPVPRSPRSPPFNISSKKVAVSFDPVRISDSPRSISLPLLLNNDTAGDSCELNQMANGFYQRPHGTPEDSPRAVLSSAFERLALPDGTTMNFGRKMSLPLLDTKYFQSNTSLFFEQYGEMRDIADTAQETLPVVLPSFETLLLSTLHDEEDEDPELVAINANAPPCI